MYEDVDEVREMNSSPVVSFGFANERLMQRPHNDALVVTIEIGG